LFAEVLLPIPVKGTYTYRVPFELNEVLAIGQRVVVEFGKRRVLTGIVTEIHERAPDRAAKYLLDLLEETPSANALQLRFWAWIAEYYLCQMGEVMNVALPSGLKISSKSRIQLHPSFELDDLTPFSDREAHLLQVLAREDSLTYDQAAEVLGIKSIYRVIKYLVSKQAVIVFEEVKEKYKPKKVSKVRLAAQWLSNADSLYELIGKLATSPKQEELLLAYLSMVPLDTDPERNQAGVEKKALLSHNGQRYSAAALTTLVKNGVLEAFSSVVSRFDAMPSRTLPLPALSDPQTRARDEILAHFQQKDQVLLFGVTGSGKTEIYIDLIQRVLENESQVLFLVPEIVLTAQMVARLRKIFGDTLGVYHSRFSDNERVETWKGVQEGRFQVIVAVRSGIFLPFNNLGLIVVDEEHEASYKQYDPAPRYHARDAAMVLAQMHHAKILLGSATPSLEGFYLAKTGKLGLVRLTERYAGATMPKFVPVDLRRERKRKRVKGAFSNVLLDEISHSLSIDKQAILFQNRRGYAPYLSCQECGEIPKCTNCAVSLTYHLYRNELRCHYCGHKQPPPTHCAHCGSNDIKTVGVGTERIEDDLKLLLPEARIQRMDLDTTRKKFSYQQIISDFEERKVDVLVGTQMVSKGLDFDHVRMVGVFDIDRMLHFPDFRSAERTFQMVTQVGGRAGRRQDEGLVLIQTGNPEQPIIRYIAQYDYEGFFEAELYERKKFFYPPFARIIELTIKHADKKFAHQAAMQITERIREKLGKKRVLGPEEPSINKIRNLYLEKTLIKLERGALDLKKAKALLLEAIHLFFAQPKNKQVQIAIDVDPL